MTLSRVVDEALASDLDESSWMLQAAQLPDFRAALRDKIAKQPELLKPAARISVLGMAFEEYDEVNLSVVKGLKAAEILSIVKHLALVENTAKSLALTLPNLPDMSLDILKQMLTAWPITKLDLGDKPMTLPALLEVVGTSKIQHFRCPGPYKRAFDTQILEGLRDTDIKGRDGAGGVCKPVIPSSVFPNGADTSFPLAQVICVRQYRSASFPRLHSGGLNWERVLHALGPKTNVGGGRSRQVDDMAPNVTMMPLQDGLLSPDAIVTALPRLLKRVLELPGAELKHVGMSKGPSAVGLQLGMAMTDDKKMHPIPGDALAAWKTYWAFSGAAGPVQTCKPGAWSLLVFHECLSPKHVDTFRPQQQLEVRYAFYTTHEAGNTEVLDGEGFFKAVALEQQAARFGADWQKASSELEKCASPHDKERRGRYQQGKVLAASKAEVHSALKLVKRYNEQVKQADNSR